MKRLLRIVILVAFPAAAAAVGIGYHAYGLARAPYKGFEDEAVFVSVEPGASSRSIALSLEREGVIANAGLFLVALELRRAGDRLKAGEYRFAGPASLLEVLDRLLRGDIIYESVTIPEGLTLWETSALLSERGIGDRAALERAFSDGRLIGALDPEAETLEGYLFPETYRFRRNPSPEEVASALVARFVQVFDDARREQAIALGFSVREVVTLASVVEKETGRAHERPLIASVFMNRLGRRMPLQSDPTIIYGLKRRGAYDGNLRRDHLRMETAYNTYTRPGLPPGPIASPGAAALDAVLAPTETPYLYFVSKNDGSHHFSTSLGEHNAAVRKYQVEYFRNGEARPQPSGPRPEPPSSG
jgi:UPF0755 protein